MWKSFWRLIDVSFLFHPNSVAHFLAQNPMETAIEHGCGWFRLVFGAHIISSLERQTSSRVWRTSNILIRTLATLTICCQTFVFVYFSFLLLWHLNFINKYNLTYFLILLRLQIVHYARILHRMCPSTYLWGVRFGRFLRALLASECGERTNRQPNTAKRITKMRNIFII